MGNILRCKKCGDIITSDERHDMNWCKCGAIAIDGGDDYCKITGKPEDMEVFVPSKLLAEKEERIKWLVEAEWNRKWANKYVEMRRKEEPKLLFPDSDEVYERYFELKHQLAEKEKQYQDAVANCVNLANTRAILKLHKVQDRIDDMKSKYDCDIEYHLGANNELTHLWEYIDKLIEEMSDGKDV